jgi:hypothetical protein
MLKFNFKDFFFFCLDVLKDRAWRKTRRPNEGSDCFGADPNRNFDIHWGGKLVTVKY